MFDPPSVLFDRLKLATDITDTLMSLKGYPALILALTNAFGLTWHHLGNFKDDVNQLIIERADDDKDGLMQRIRRAL